MEGKDSPSVSTPNANTTTINANTINPKAIKAAQEEIAKLDIHVCGQCHSVFHFIDEFQEHRTKDGGCTKRSNLRDNSSNEQKVQVWAFLLWKDTQIQNDSPDKENTWKLYQKWCQMDTHVRDCWIMAGKTIQTFTKIGNAKMQDVGRHQGTILTEGGKTVVVRKIIKNGQPESPMKNKTDIIRVKSEPMDKLKVKLGPSNQLKQTSNETGENNNENSDDEYVVEKILAKRFNPKKKVHEYLLKWEGYAHEFNTWEEVNHVSVTCKQLMDEFEKNLAKQKELKAQQVTKSINRNQITVGQKLVKVETIKAGPSTPQSGRPMRSSKSKAMDQVKQWCGSMKDEDNELGKRKIVFTDSDSEDDGLAALSTTKRSKLDSGDDEWAADSEEDKIVIGRSDVIQRAFNRANAQSNGTNRGPLTGTDIAKGLLKPRQDGKGSPATSVYMVHRKEGVIKLDSTPTNKISVKGQHAPPTSNVLVLPSRDGLIKKQTIVSSANSITPSKIVNKPDGTQVVTQMKVIPKPSPINKTMVKTEPIKIQPKPEHKPGQTVQMVTSVSSPAGIRSTMTTTMPATTTTTTTIVRSNNQRLSDRPLLPRPSPGMTRGTTPVLTNVQQRSNANSPRTPTMQQQQQSLQKRVPSLGPQVSITPAKPKVTVTNNRGQVLRTTNNASSRNIPAKSPANLTPTQKMIMARNKVAQEAGKLPVRTPVKPTGARSRTGHSNNEPCNKPKESKLAETDGLHMEFHEVESEESTSEEDPPFPAAEVSAAQPEPESPPRELTLCPLTGRLIGPDGQPVEQPEPPLQPTTSTPMPMAIVTANSATDVTVATSSSAAEIVLPSLDTLAEASAAGVVRVEMSPGGTTGTIVPAEPAVVVPGPDLPCLDDPNIEMHPATAVPQQPQHVVTSEGLVVPASSLAAHETSILPEMTPPQETVTVPVTSAADIGTNVKLEESGGLVTITGEDGVVYQVTGQADDGQTLLVTRGPDGEQQCVYVTTAEQQNEEAAVGTLLTLDHAVAEAVAQLGPDQAAGSSQFYVKETPEGTIVEGAEATSSQSQLVVMDNSNTATSGVAGGENDTQVVAQVIQAEEPTADGKRRVVLLLPDGNLMMTEVDEEQYAALELDK